MHSGFFGIIRAPFLQGRADLDEEAEEAQVHQGGSQLATVHSAVASGLLQTVDICTRIIVGFRVWLSALILFAGGYCFLLACGMFYL